MNKRVIIIFSVFSLVIVLYCYMFFCENPITKNVAEYVAERYAIVRRFVPYETIENIYNYKDRSYHIVLVTTVDNQSYAKCSLRVYFRF